jgi:cysteine desulfurase
MTEKPGPVYLDHNASTPVLPEVLDEMLPYLTHRFGNPSSAHAFGRPLRQAIEKAREQLAALIDCDTWEVYFTCGGTEANNLAIRGVAEANPARRNIVTSVVEHPATSQPCAWLENRGYCVDRLPVDGFGTIRLLDARSTIGKKTLLVTVIHAHSETGTLQPVQTISDIAHEAGSLIHTDAAQAVGKIPVSVQQERVDLMSVAGHKLYAPQGVGALFVRSGTAVAPVVTGAGHERGLRPGTENVAAIVGLGKAAEIARLSLASESVRVSKLRDRLWSRLQQQIPKIELNGHPNTRLPNTLSVRFPGVSGGTLLDFCPAVAASTGSACHESGSAASAAILAMGVPPDQAIGTVRLTLGRDNDQSQIDRAADELAKAWSLLAQES